MANMVVDDSSLTISEKAVLVSAEKYAQFSQYQASLESSTSPVNAIAESGKSTTSLVSSKWVIDYSVTDHMTGNSSLLSNF